MKKHCTIKRVIAFALTLALFGTGLVFTAISALASERVYLEHNIHPSTPPSGITSHPSAGRLNMDGVDYDYGIRNQHDGYTGTIEYNITDKGYTRLSAVFGMENGSNGGSLTIMGWDIARNHYVVLAGFVLGQGDSSRQIDVDIPVGMVQIHIRLQANGFTRLALADAYFIADGQASQQIQPQLLSATVTGADYLQNDIFPPTRGSGITGYPENGSFSMKRADLTTAYYFRGIRNQHDGYTGTIEYNIADKGYTRLSAVFGMENGSNGGSLTIMGDGALLEGGGVTLNQGDVPKEIDLVIPPGTSQIHIRLQANGFTRLALADAYFIADGQPQPPQTSIPNNHSPWAEEELLKAVELGLIPDSLADPSIDYTRPVTRAEFAGIIVKTYESLTNSTIQPAVTNPFTDTNAADVLKAYNADLMIGTSGTAFSPNGILNREQAATALTRVYKSKTFTGWTYATDADYPLDYVQPPLFADDLYISDWAREGVYFMVAHEIILGIEGYMFAPRAMTSAEEAAGYAVATIEQAIAIAVRMSENLG